MNLPKIDLAALPDLHSLVGMFGSLVHPLHAQSNDDTVILLMTYLYEIIEPQNLI